MTGWALVWVFVAAAVLAAVVTCGVAYWLERRDYR